MEFYALASLLNLAVKTNIHIDLKAFLDSLPMMLYGMLGIFIVTLTIMLGVKILFTLFPADKKPKEKKEEKKKE